MFNEGCTYLQLYTHYCCMSIAHESHLADDKESCSSSSSMLGHYHDYQQREVLFGYRDPQLQVGKNKFPGNTKHLYHINAMLDFGPTLYECDTNVLCLLGYRTCFNKRPYYNKRPLPWF